MEKLNVVIHILSALNGKITGSFMGQPSVRAVSEEYARIRSMYHADAWLYGTTTTKEFTGFCKPQLNEAEKDISDSDFVAQDDAGFYYVSIDTLGEIGWKSGVFRKEGRPDAHVIEVLTQRTSSAYRAYLQKHGVSYILAGEDALDCKIACEKLYRLFGIRTILICGGGAVNWTFLQQGMVDEVSLIIAPAADGDPNTVSVFEQSAFLDKSHPIEFQMKDAKPLCGNGIQLLYSVSRKG